MSALVWLVVGLALVGAELLTLDLVLVMLGVAALAAAGVALAGGELWLQLVTVALASGALLVGVRPLARRHLEVRGLPQGADALTGRTAVVVALVSEDSGQVRIDGELWRARPYAGGRDLLVGETVVVARVDGVTLHVYPEELL